MPRFLLIVESPAKARTIAHYLGPEYVVLASVGHVRDLPPKELGVDVDRDFAPTYELSPGKSKIISAIRSAASKAETVYLATDLDREGEAIAWHVAEAAGIDRARTRRITFDQITRTAIVEALKRPRDLDQDLIDAQQARRVLDRLVGYQISPILSKALHKGLSAGRVQSVAVRLIVDREREIQAFAPEEYWTLDADLQRRIAAKERFRARLFKIRGESPALRTRADVDAVLEALRGATYRVERVSTGQRVRRPQPPFITSTLQAEAGRKLGKAPKATMALAQQLYEGIDLGEGEPIGLITYMRTDSAHVAPDAQAEARTLIAQRYGVDSLPDQPPTYPSRKGAQEAHEAIRPTSALRAPEAIRPHVSDDQYRLYALIWQRFIASQMKPALYATLTVDINAAEYYLFRATGATLIHPGYLAVYEEGRDDDAEPEQALPPLVEGEWLDLIRLCPDQHFTQPPPRYTEPTLIKALEEHGVGRPSTYAAIVGVIQERDYVIKQSGRLHPTALGMVVCDALLATFADIMDPGYTAGMEQQLDRIAEGALGYAPMLTSFYRAFGSQVAQATKQMPTAVEQALWAGVSPEVRAMTCPQHHKPLVVKLSAAGRFLSCPDYRDHPTPYTLDLSPTGELVQRTVEHAEGEVCAKCGGRMQIVTRGRDRYLRCERGDSTSPILSAAIRGLAAERACPACGYRPIEPRKGRYGEYLHCPGCGVNIAVRKPRKGQPADGPVELRVSAPPQSVALVCPGCGHQGMQKRAGRYGPYYRCPACKKNYAAHKMESGAAPPSAQPGAPQESS